MLVIETSSENTRIYRNTVTGNEVITKKVYTDNSGNHWWIFKDLMNIPYIREQVSRRFTSLFNSYLSENDINKFLSILKEEAKTNPVDLNIRLTAHIFNFEQLKQQVVDVNVKNITLCTVYCLMDNENPETWNETLYQEKMEYFRHDLPLYTFFLNWLADGIKLYTKLYKSTSPTALNNQPEQ